MDSNLRSPRVREVRGIEPLQTLIHEQAKSIIAIKELQNEVSSLLEFKNALLETFPHLQNRFSTPTTLQPTRGSQTPVYGVGRRDHRPGYLLSHTQPYSPSRHVDVVSSDETQPSWTGLDTGQLTTGYQTGQNISGIPGSTNVGTSMSTSRNFRKNHNASKKNFPDSSGQNHLAADSGFSTETSKETASGGSDVLSPTSATTVKSAQTVDVRWDWSPGVNGNRPQPPAQHDDELMVLLDLIHRKSVRLRNEVEDNVKTEIIHPDGNIQRLLPRMSHPSTLRVIDENEPPESSQSTVINQVSQKLELEVDTLRREREVLISRIGELESENANAHGRLGELEAQMAKFNSPGNTSADSSGPSSKKVTLDKEDEAGIIHSVHIRTGGGEEGIRRTMRSVSQGDLSVMSPNQGGDLRIASGSSVNIEIKNGDLVKARSQDHLSQGPPTAPARSVLHQHRYSQPATLLAPAISVVNLRHPPGVLENLLPQHPNKSYSFNELSGGLSRYHSRGANHTFGIPQPLKTQHTSRGLLLPGRMALPGSSPSAKGDPTSKSKSVENLLGTDGYPGGPTLGLKSSNSEMNVHRHSVGGHLGVPKPVRLKGTTSELNVSKLGQSEKVRFDIIDGIASLPAEIKGIKPVQIRPNRDKVRTILSMSNVIELQRQLLTTVMENEVYRSQLERVTESWKEKIGSFENLNSKLQSNLAELRQENEDLKHQMKNRTSELETTKSKLRILGLETTETSSSATDPTVEESNLGAQTLTKSENRVQFDLKTTRPTTARLKTTLTTTPGTTNSVGMAMGTRRLLPGTHGSQLPSDARQRLEEMANSGVRRQTFLGQQLKPNNPTPVTSVTTASSVSTTTIPSSSASNTNQISTSVQQPPVRMPRRSSVGMNGNGSRANSPVKHVHLDPIQELLSQHQNIVGSKSNSVSTNLYNPSNNAILQNANNNYNSSQQLRSRQDSTSTTSSTTQVRSTPQTPLTREKSLNLKNSNGGGMSNNNSNSSNIGFSGNTRALIDSSVEMDSSEMIENNNSKKASHSLGVRQLPVILDGILEKIPREAFADIEEQDEPDDHFDAVSLGSEIIPNKNPAPSPLFQHVMLPSGCHSLPQSIGPKKSTNGSSFCGSSWEANNHLEETTNASHILQSSLKVEEIDYRLLSSTTGSQDSLSKKLPDSLSQMDEKTAGFEMDSITYDFRQASPEDSLNNAQKLVNQLDSYFDSLGYVASRRDELKKDSVSTPKKLIIPYHDSYSSNTSVYSGSRESLAQSDYNASSASSKTAEPDSLANNDSIEEQNENMSLAILQVQQCQKEKLPLPNNVPKTPEPHQTNRMNGSMYGGSPPTLRPDTWHTAGYPRPYRGLENPTTVGSVPSSRTQSPICVVGQPNAPVSQSLMRMATERMKRKFLGWS